MHRLIAVISFVTVLFAMEAAKAGPTAGVVRNGPALPGAWASAGVHPRESGGRNPGASFVLRLGSRLRGNVEIGQPVPTHRGYKTLAVT